MTLSYCQAAENNKEPISAVLRGAFANTRHVLEIASGTGQHAVHLGGALPYLLWQSSELAENLPDLRARIDAEGPENVKAPIELDVARQPWPVTEVDAIFCANAIHIMSWEHVENFFGGIGRVLAQEGLLGLYGPFKYDGAFTTESNARFDQWLKSRDQVSGIRDFEQVDALARAHRFLT